MKICKFAVALALTCSAHLSRGEIDSLKWNVHCAAQAANGRIFAVLNQSSAASYSRRVGGEWLPTNLGAGARVARLQTLEDGNVYALWNGVWGSHDVTLNISRLSDDGSVTCLKGLQARVEDVELFVDSRTNLWVTQPSGEIFKVSANGDSNLVHTVTLEEFGNSGAPRLSAAAHSALRRSPTVYSQFGRAPFRLPIQIAEDPHGRIWFWQRPNIFGDEPAFRYPALRGALIYNHDTVTNVPVVKGMPATQFTAIARLDEKRFWIATRDHGIFALSADTLSATAIDTPQNNDFKNVQKMFAADGDVYVLAGVTATQSKDLRGSLWRLHDKTWTQVLSGTDKAVEAPYAIHRELLETKEGLWIAACGTGGWFIPKHSTNVIQLDWHVASPVSRVDRWLKLPNNEVGAIQFNHTAWVIHPAAMLTNRPSNVQIFPAVQPFIESPNGYIYGFFKNKNTLSGWDGQTWHEFTIPSDLQWRSESTGHRLFADSRDRLWIVRFPYAAGENIPSYIFDPKQGTFQTFSNYEGAAEAQLNNTNLTFTRGKFIEPHFGKDHQILIEDTSEKLYYFDGHKWFDWSKLELTHESALVYPGFDEQGHPRILARDTYWHFTEAQGWHKLPDEKPINRYDVELRRSTWTPNGRAIIDRRDMEWTLGAGKLVRSGYSLNETWFAPDEPNPFVDGRSLRQVLIDEAGNVFADTFNNSAGEEMVLLPVQVRAPKTSIRIKQSDDATTLALSADLKDVRFTWRLDGAPWSNAQTNSTVVLNNLSPGQHHFEALAIARRLQTQNEPAAAQFKIEYAPDRIDNLISQLNNPDFHKRESAVKALASTPEPSIAALGKAIAATPSADHWWLEAAIEECRQAQRKQQPGK